MKWLLAAVLILVFGVTVSCAAMAGNPPAAGKKIPVEILYSGNQCGAALPGASVDWIAQPEGLDLPFLRQDGLRSGLKLTWDPARAGVLRIQMGRKPTGGYRLELAAPTAEVKNNTALIRVNWHRPRPGTLVSQVITSPCLLLKVPKQGISMIHVIDQTGKIRGKVAIPRF